MKAQFFLPIIVLWVLVGDAAAVQGGWPGYALPLFPVVSAAPKVATVVVNPGEDIQAAIDSAGGTATERATVVLTSGVHTVNLPLSVEHVDLIGEGVDATILRASTITSTVALLYFNCSLQNLTVELDPAFTGEGATLVAILEPFVQPIEVQKCRLDGKWPGVSAASTGFLVEQGTRDQVVIEDSEILNLTTGIMAMDSGVNVTRCLFQGIEGVAVMVIGTVKGAKQSGETVPILGDATDIEHTALNQFRQIGAEFIFNSTTTEILAEMNDWGTYDEELVRAGMFGPSDSGPFLGKAIGPGTVLASLVDEASAPIPATANPTCAIPALQMTGERDDVSGSFIFNGVPEGQHLVEATAQGFGTTNETIDVNSETVTPVSLVLAAGGALCGSQAKLAYACCILVILVAGKWRPRSP